jgi:large subunit ribosomal protein L6
MSRIGRQPITIPARVSVEIQSRRVKVAGPKGALELELLPTVTAEQIGDQLIISQAANRPETAKTFGLMRTLVANMVTGVAEGFSRQLEIHGVGYRASVAGSTVNLNLGFSHPVAFALPAGIEAKVEKNVITISGPDKQTVGQVAADLRALKKPEPYKGKGIKYSDEHVRRKAGKTAVKG